MAMEIGCVSTKNNIFLAPMAGVSDSSFRIICNNMGASLCYSEMVSAKALMYHDKKTKKLLNIDNREGPAIIQIFGSDPEAMAYGAKTVEELGTCVAIDINMGCPTPKITSNGDGCSLMRDLPHAKRIIESVVGAVKNPRYH